jgi:hypothetical protein
MNDVLHSERVFVLFDPMLAVGHCGQMVDAFASLKWPDNPDGLAAVYLEVSWILEDTIANCHCQGQRDSSATAKHDKDKPTILTMLGTLYIRKTSSPSGHVGIVTSSPYPFYVGARRQEDYPRKPRAPSQVGVQMYHHKVNRWS